MFRLARLFSIISFVFVFVGCSPLKMEGKKLEKSFEPYQNPHFSELGGEYLYNGKITLFDHSINGILVIKNRDDITTRLALLSDFGNTLLDFEFTGEKTIVHSILPDLDKKIIVNKLKDYFQLMVQPQFILKDSYLSNALDNTVIHVSHLQGKRVFIYDNMSHKNFRLRQTSRLKEIADIRFIGDTIYPDSIVFQSKERRVKMMFGRRDF